MYKKARRLNGEEILINLIAIAALLGVIVVVPTVIHAVSEAISTWLPR